MFASMNLPEQHINLVAIAVVFSWIQSVFIHPALFFGASYSDCCVVGDIVVFG